MGETAHLSKFIPIRSQNQGLIKANSENNGRGMNPDYYCEHTWDCYNSPLITRRGLSE